MRPVQASARESGRRIGVFFRQLGEAIRHSPPKERLGDDLETPEEEAARRGSHSRYVIDKQAAWLCLFAAGACGVALGFLLAALALVVS